MTDNHKDASQGKIAKGIDEALDQVIIQRNEYYQKNPAKIPERSSIESMISSTAMKNAAISGGASLIPGPWGMAAVIPEITLVIRNQIILIYDIAAAHQKKDIMTKELLATILSYSMGNISGSLIVFKGGQYFVKRTSLRVLQKLITALGGRVTQQVLKSTISKWLPGVGAAAMAAWSNYSTKQIGKKANEILGSQIIFEDTLQDIELIEPIFQKNASASTQVVSNEFCKLQIIIALARIDGNIHEKEKEFIKNSIEISGFDTATQSKLYNLLDGIGKPDTQCLSEIKKSSIESIALMVDLVALAKIDGNVHVTERLFIKQVGREIGLSDSEVDDLLVD